MIFSNSVFDIPIPLSFMLIAFSLISTSTVSSEYLRAFSIIFAIAISIRVGSISTKISFFPFKIISLLLKFWLISSTICSVKLYMFVFIKSGVNFFSSNLIDNLNLSISRDNFSPFECILVKNFSLILGFIFLSFRSV